MHFKLHYVALLCNKYFLSIIYLYCYNINELMPIPKIINCCYLFYDIFFKLCLIMHLSQQYAKNYAHFLLFIM